MTIAERFRAALAAAGGPGLEGPELLPERLARATATMLPVDGAGLSLLDAEQRRMPLGASSEQAAEAERIQFTVGSGPCTAAQQTGEPVFAPEEELQRRWPAFTEKLVARTPYRAVVGLPLQRALVGIGAMDLYLVDPDRVAHLDVFEVLAVGELVTSELADAAIFSTWSTERGPDWLNAPAVQRRTAVWEAIGKLGLDLDVGASAALELLRAHAFASDRVVDDVAVDLLTARLEPGDLLTARSQPGDLRSSEPHG
ncbi:GAF domain-containing protein [Geodermatophilus sp. YIM 151500]|uniref:GAF domain-containing protein n=1 Tax=Geodermatophilus sp. YIM 151500 TaxID=2984531 RepID=UPI0021E406F2|nr:GAF domain-containing protein [Geodermatophilus sp. YIM 151500]MCV2490690.1 GAF domain-containing protein [Geodermatophilus sp. YIM 151500]